MAGKNHKRYSIRKRMNAIKHEPKRLFDDPPILISTWEELGKAYSETHYIELSKEGWNGHVRPKDESLNEGDSYWRHNMYLSTHTFYGSSYYYMTTKLRELGFNIQLANWDGETMYAIH